MDPEIAILKPMDQKGFALLEVLLVVVVIMLIAGGGFYLDYTEQSQNAAHAGANAIQAAKQVVQQLNSETASSGEQSSLDELQRNATAAPKPSATTTATSSSGGT